MKALSIEQACAYVRTALDELQSAGDGDMLVSPDALDLTKQVENTMVEAVLRTHLAAPASLLDGKEGVLGTDYDAKRDASTSVLTITMKKKTARIVSVKLSDSDYPVTEIHAEDSPVGRMQQDKYTRGVPDDPVVVMQKNTAGEHLPVLKYYTTKLENIVETSVTIEYVPYPAVENGAVQICPRMEMATLNELTAMVMENLSMTDKAAVYRTRATEYLK